MKLSLASSQSQNSRLFSPAQSYNIQSYSNTAKNADTNPQTNNIHQQRQQLNSKTNNYISYDQDQFNPQPQSKYEGNKSPVIQNQNQLSLSPNQQTISSSIPERDLLQRNPSTSFQKSPKQVTFSDENTSQCQKNQENMNLQREEKEELEYQIQQPQQESFSDKIRVEDNKQFQRLIQNSDLQQTQGLYQNSYSGLNKEYQNVISDNNRQIQNYYLQQQEKSIIKEETEEDSDFKNSFKDNIDNYRAQVDNYKGNLDNNSYITNNLRENKFYKEGQGYNYMNEEQLEQKQYFKDPNLQDEENQKQINKNGNGENKKVSAIKNSIQNRLEELERKIQMVNNTDGQVYKVLDQIDHNLQESTSELDNISINSKSFRTFSHRGEIESNKITPRIQNNDDNNTPSNTLVKTQKNEIQSGTSTQNFFFKTQKRNSGSYYGCSQVQSPYSSTSQRNDNFQYGPYIQDNFENSMNVNDIQKPYSLQSYHHNNNFSFRDRAEVDSERFVNFDKKKLDDQFRRNLHMQEKIIDNNRIEPIKQHTQNSMNRSELEISYNNEYSRQNMSFASLNKSSSELKHALNEQLSRSLSKHKELNKIKDQIAIELEKQKQRSFQKINHSNTLGSILQQNNSQTSSSQNWKTQLHSNIIPDPYSFDKSKSNKSDLFNLSNLDAIDHKINQSLYSLNKQSQINQDRSNTNQIQQDFPKPNIQYNQQISKQDIINQSQQGQNNDIDNNLKQPINYKLDNLNIQNEKLKNVDQEKITIQNQPIHTVQDQKLQPKLDYSNTNKQNPQQIDFYDKTKSPRQDQSNISKIEETKIFLNDSQNIQRKQSNQSDNRINLRNNSFQKQDISNEITPQSQISSKLPISNSISPINTNNEYAANKNKMPNEDFENKILQNTTKQDQSFTNQSNTMKQDNLNVSKQNSQQNNTQILANNSFNKQQNQQDITPSSNSSYLQGITPMSKSPISNLNAQNYEQNIANLKINNLSDDQNQKEHRKSSTNTQILPNQSNLSNINMQNNEKENKESRLYQTVKNQIQQKNECNSPSNKQLTETILEAQKYQIDRSQQGNNLENKSFQSSANTSQISRLQNYPENDLNKSRNRLQIKSLSEYGEKKRNSTKHLDIESNKYQKKVNQIKKDIDDSKVYSKIENKVSECINNFQNEKNNESQQTISRQKSPKSSTNKYSNQMTNQGFSGSLNQTKTEIPNQFDQSKMVDLKSSFGYIHPNLRSTSRSRKSVKFINTQANNELSRSISNTKNGKHEEKIKKIISQKVYTWLNKPTPQQQRALVNENKLTSKLYKSYLNSTTNSCHYNLNKTYSNN